MFGEVWTETLQRPEAYQIIIAVTVLLILAAMGYYLIGVVRSGQEDGPPSASDVLSSFRELHEEGELDDDEFRNIKAKLSARMQEELKRPAAKPRGDEATRTSSDSSQVRSHDV